MDYTAKFMSNEHQEQYRSASESADPSSASPLVIPSTSKSPRSPRSPKSPRSPRSPRGKSSGSPGSPLKNQKSHSGRAGDPKKGEYLILF